MRVVRGFGINAKADIAAIRRDLRVLAKDELPFVTAHALTKTAQDIKAAEIAEMTSVFDRPTRFTLNALYVKPATKTDLSAVVEFKEGFGSIPAWRYLGPQVEGGARAKKAHERRLERAGILRSDEFVVPGKGIKLDAFGNVPGGIIERILSQLGAAEQRAGYTANATARSLKRASRRNVGRYFVLRGTAAADGVYHRISVREAVPVLMFVKAPRYQKRFAFYEIGARVFDERFALRYREGFQRYVVDSARRRKAA